MSLNGTGLDLSDVADDLLAELCASDDYVIAYKDAEVCDQVTGQCAGGELKTIQLYSGYEDTASIGLIDQSNIKAGDIFLLIAPSVTLPSVTYWFIVRGRRYSIVNTAPFVNSGVTQYIEFQLRSS